MFEQIHGDVILSYDNRIFWLGVGATMSS